MDAYAEDGLADMNGDIELDDDLSDISSDE